MSAIRHRNGGLRFCRSSRRFLSPLRCGPATRPLALATILVYSRYRGKLLGAPRTERPLDRTPLAVLIARIGGARGNRLAFEFLGELLVKAAVRIDEQPRTRPCKP